MPKTPEPISGYVPVIGVVGGIGSGKSRLASMLSNGFPIVTIDADTVGHEVLAEEQVKKEISARFGNSVFHSNGMISRRALGRVVFGTSKESEKAKHDLEAIVHPRIGDILRKQIAAAKSGTKTSAVILDAPVLLEAGWDEFCDAIVYIDAPHEIRCKRVTDHRNWTVDEFEAREANQLPLNEKKLRADYEIDNSGEAADAYSEFFEILLKITNTPPSNQG